MFSWKTRTDKPIVIAHRGASVTAPENTIAAFKKAIDEGTHAIELDVRLSHDNEVVVIHDSRLERTTSGRGKVEDFDLEGLKNFDAGSWFNPKYSVEVIPTLEEVFKLVNKKVGINIEIKQKIKNKNKIINSCVELAHKYKLNKSLLITSFEHSLVKKVKQLDSTLMTGIIYSPVIHLVNNPISLAKQYLADVIVVSRNYLRERMVIDAHKEKKMIFVYTIENRNHFDSMVNLNVDGIITNVPKSMKYYLSNL
ncbi:MAG: glycerophosphodiester phosphodiesterase family protein [Bacteroidota bacterium]|nr:glycerophosphodiester phosphodiesterase family protein [Bacteroidota bacterium]